VKVLIVLVLYQVRLNESPAFRSLLTNGIGTEIVNDFELLVYDNGGQVWNEARSQTGQYLYIKDPTNGGLVSAYNTALDIANSKGFEWLLLLDQDTEIPKGVICRLKAVIGEVAKDAGVAAIVPKVYSGSLLISPMKVNFGWRLKKIELSFTGTVQNRITAVNSGSVIRVSFLNELGGFDNRFSLDYLDHWLFSEIHAASRSVYISEQILNHDLSVINFEKNVSNHRYGSILAGEYQFFCQCGTMDEWFSYLLRLIFRCFKQFLHTSTRSYAQMTYGQLKRVLHCCLYNTEKFR